MVRLIHKTENAEQLIGFMARVSSPKQSNPEVSHLIKYLIKNRHWSPLEMANLCLEIVTSRAIAQQIIRHRSFSFQEFSQRYSEVNKQVIYSARRQDEKNRQNSIDNLPIETQNWFNIAQEEVNFLSNSLYKQALNRGIAKESARVLLPLSTETKLYMNGSLRSWVHYINLRTEEGTQKEHRDIAEEIKQLFIKEFPVISEALDWTKKG